MILIGNIYEIYKKKVSVETMKLMNKHHLHRPISNHSSFKI